MSAISDIDISYSDIGTKYVRLNPLIPISEEFWYRHQLPFRYRTKSISDIPISRIDQSFPNDPRKILILIIMLHWIRTHSLHVKYMTCYHCARRVYKYWCQISDVGQKFIPISDIMLDSAHFSPISIVPISTSVRYRWSRISDWVPTYAIYQCNVTATTYFRTYISALLNTWFLTMHTSSLFVVYLLHQW